AQYGAPVRSAADGFVVWAGRRSGFGRLVVVDHGGGVTTWYAHMSSVRGYAGQSVKRGDVVGYVGSSGRAKGNHLHYEVRLNNAPLNPWNFLRTDSLIARRGRFPTIGSSD
ncbi:MAG: M23 family metallopeptidase, partial [Terriglobia bacterium]